MGEWQVHTAEECKVGDIMAIFDQYTLPWWHKWSIQFCHTDDKGRYFWKQFPVNCTGDKQLNLYIFFPVGEPRKFTVESLSQDLENLEEENSRYGKSSKKFLLHAN